MWKAVIWSSSFVLWMLLSAFWAGSELWGRYEERPLVWSNGVVEVWVGATCSVVEGPLAWPVSHCDGPWIGVRRQASFGSEVRAEFNGVTIDKNRSLNLSDFLDRADGASDPLLSIAVEDYSYNWGSGGSLTLEGFHGRVAEHIEHSESYAHVVANKRRLFVLLGLGLGLVGFLLGGALLWYLAKNFNRFVDAVSGWTARRLAVFQGALEANRVRRVAVDEAVKQSVRATFANDDEKGADELTRLIKSALDRGDAEAAKALLSKLERADKSSGSK